jgi:diguanylate cyclase (GGDEF)-like protein
MPSSEQAALVMAAVEAGPMPTALFDPDDVLRFCNPRYETLFLRGRALPISFADLIRHGFHGGFGVKIDSGDVEAFLADVLQRRRALPRRAFASDLVDGSWMWITETLLDNGWMLSVMTDITTLKQEERVLRQARDKAVAAAMTDALTGLPNRRRILDELHGAMTSAMDARQPLSVAIVDVDHFKPINDRYGHLGGDEALRGFAGYLAGAASGLGQVGRIGGEEFLLIMRGTPADAALARVDAIRNAVPPAQLGNQRSLPLTFSAGVAEYDGSEGYSSFMRRADLALYRAKAAGRNRVEFA